MPITKDNQQCHLRRTDLQEAIAAYIESAQSCNHSWEQIAGEIVDTLYEATDGEITLDAKLR